MKIARPIVESFVSAREYLHAFFTFRKSQRGGFTYSQLSEQTGISVGLLNMMFNGKRTLDLSHMPAIARAFDLRADEIRFLEQLIRLEAETDPAHKQTILKKLSRRTSFRGHHSLDASYLEYLSKWYIGAILELVEAPDFEPDAEKLSMRMLPRVTPSEVREALDVLQRLELVTVGTDGRWQRNVKTLQTPDEGLNRQILTNYHVQRLETARWALVNLPSPQRNFGAVTGRVNAQGWTELQQEIHAIRHHITQFLVDRQVPDADIVVHVNWQSYPVTQALGEAVSDKKEKP